MKFKITKKMYFNKSNKKFYNKAYYYSLDAFIAILIITLGVFIIIQSSNVRHQPLSNVVMFSQDLSNYLSNTRVYDLNDELYPTTIKQWRKDGNITNFDNTLMEQAAEFYAAGKMQHANELLGTTVSNINNASIYSFDISVNGVSLYSYSKVPQENAKSVVSSKTIVAGSIGSSQSWGPYVADVRAWQ